MFELRRYRSHTPEAVVSGTEVDALLTSLTQRGWFINLAEVDTAGDLLVIGEHELETTADDDPQGPLRLVDRMAHVRLRTADRSQALAVADSTTRDPRTTAWHSVELAPDWTTILVTFGHGANQGLHHVDVTETPTRIVVTVHVGTRADFTGGPVPLMLLLRRVAIELNDPVADRVVVDGAT